MAEQYKGMLNYLDGRKRLIAVPGDHKNGTYYVPESDNIEGKLFMLNKIQHSDEWFSYDEVEKPLAKVLPFKLHLH